MNIEEQIKWLSAMIESGTYLPEDKATAGHVLKTLQKLQAKKPTLLWHHSTPSKRGVYPVKCDGPNPNQGFRYWDGDRWCAWSRTHKGAHLMGLDPMVRKAQLSRPVMYATKGKAK